MSTHLREAWAQRIEAASADTVWKKLTTTVRARILRDAPKWMGEPGEFATYYPEEARTQVLAGTVGVVKAWGKGGTLPYSYDYTRRDEYDLPVRLKEKHKLGDHFLVSFPTVQGAPTILLGEEAIELLDPIPRRKP